MTTKITVERPGMLTTVQDYPGRTGYWQVGVPPSGPMDDLSFRLGNVALGNSEGAPGLETTMAGPALRFTEPTEVCVTGAPVTVRVDGVPVDWWVEGEGETAVVHATQLAGLARGLAQAAGRFWARHAVELVLTEPERAQELRVEAALDPFQAAG